MRVFADAGEQFEKPKCPGKGCDLWEATEGAPDEERVLVTRDCRQCSGPPEEGADEVDPEVSELVESIDDLILYQDAGSETDWSLYPVEYLWLTGQWRRAERMVAALRQEKLVRMMAGVAAPTNART